MSDYTPISLGLTGAARFCLGTFERDAYLQDQELAGLKQSASYREIAFTDDVYGYKFTVKESTWEGDVPDEASSELQEIEVVYDKDKILKISCFPLDDLVIVVDDGRLENLESDEVEMLIDIMQGAANRLKDNLDKKLSEMNTAIRNKFDMSEEQIDLPGYDFRDGHTVNMEIYQYDGLVYSRVEIEKEGRNSAYYFDLQDHTLYYYEDDDVIEGQVKCTYDFKHIDEFIRICRSVLD